MIQTRRISKNQLSVSLLEDGGQLSPPGPIGIPMVMYSTGRNKSVRNSGYLAVGFIETLFFSMKLEIARAVLFPLKVLSSP